MTADSPTPPNPITATLEPGSTGTFSSPPQRMTREHPMSAATSGGVPSGIGIAAAAGTTCDDAIVPIAQYVRTSTPPPARRVREVPSGIRWLYDSNTGHSREPRPATHDRQRPHGTSHDSATSRPTLSPVATGSSPGAEHLDVAGALVAHHDQAGHCHFAVADVEVRVAEAPDAAIRTSTFTGPRLVKRQLLDPWLGPGRLEDGGADRQGGACAASIPAGRR